MSKVPPGTKVTPGTRGEPLAYVTRAIVVVPVSLLVAMFGSNSGGASGRTGVVGSGS